MPSSLILPAMKKTAILAAILLLGTLPAAAQSTEFGVLFGGSAARPRAIPTLMT
jgi:hypothetical protein